MPLESNTDNVVTASINDGWLVRYSPQRLRLLIAELYRWWWRELAGMVPASWRIWSAPALRVEASANELLIFDPRQEMPVDRIDLADPAATDENRTGLKTQCEVVMNSDLVLSTSISLPIAAEQNLRSVVGFSMDRYTPFKEEDVRFDVRITGRDRQNGRIEVMLYVVPRATLERIVAALAAKGIETVTVDYTESRQEERRRAGINLLPEDGQKTVITSRINGALAITSLILLFAVMALPIYQRHQKVKQLEQDLSALNASVQEAERLRADVNRRSDTLRAILKRRNAAPPVLDLLRELTRLTPDEAWAGQIEIKEGRLRLTGEAAAGSELMQALTNSDYFSDPRFEAPLTENPKSGRERFVISLAIKERTDGH